MKRLIKVLEKVGMADGIVCMSDLEHKLGFKGNSIDNYLAVRTLAELLENKEVELIFKSGRENPRIKYFLKLLGE